MPLSRKHEGIKGLYTMEITLTPTAVTTVQQFIQEQAEDGENEGNHGGSLALGHVGIGQIEPNGHRHRDYLRHR